MRLSYRSGNLRLRLTLWYGTTFAILLLFYVGIASFVHYRQLVHQTFRAEIEDLETVEGLLYQTPDGRVALNEGYLNQPKSRQLFDRLLEVLSPEGTVLYQNRKLNGVRIDGPLTPGDGVGTYSELNGMTIEGTPEGVGTYNERVVTLSDGRRVMAISHLHWLNGRPVILRLAYDEAPLLATVGRFLTVLLLIAPLLCLFAAWVVFEVTSEALSPLRIMVHKAQQITAERLNERLPVHDPSDDLGRAALVFNKLLQRLEDSFLQLKRFTSDASHELRTPLACLRSVGEVSLQFNHSDQHYREVIASMLEEADRLTHLVESLLAISRSESGQMVLRMESFSCVELIQEITDLVGVLAEEKRKGIHISGAQEIVVFADRGILKQAIMNLVDNAIKYSPPEAAIVIEVQRLSKEMAEIAVIDEGPGIPEEERTRVFDRFHRVDEGRSRESGGFGLGLSIAKWAVEAHRGAIGVLPGSAGGCRFYIRLPVGNGNRSA
jgi:heavy metal sensor kinase